MFKRFNKTIQNDDFEYNNNKYKLILSNNIEFIGPIPYFERTLHRRVRAVAVTKFNSSKSMERTNIGPSFTD